MLQAIKCRPKHPETLNLEGRFSRLFATSSPSSVKTRFLMSKLYTHKEHPSGKFPSGTWTHQTCREAPSDSPLQSLQFWWRLSFRHPCCSPTKWVCLRKVPLSSWLGKNQVYILLFSRKSPTNWICLAAWKAASIQISATAKVLYSDRLQKFLEVLQQNWKRAWVLTESKDK